MGRRTQEKDTGNAAGRLQYQTERGQRERGANGKVRFAQRSERGGE